jgi:hypothetical protein
MGKNLESHTPIMKKSATGDDQAKQQVQPVNAKPQV